MIKIDKISKTIFKARKESSLHQLSLVADPNESVAILGQSGSGKSTLLSLLAGLDFPDFGSIQINGQEIQKLNQNQLSQFRSECLGIVFQQYHLMSNLTAIENVGLPLELRKDSSYAESAREALSQVGLSHRLSHFTISTFWRGMSEGCNPRTIVGKQGNSCRRTIGTG